MGVTEATTLGWTAVHPHERTRQQGSLGWLAVAVAVSIVLVMILGAMAQERWCGAELCDVQIESY